MMMPDILEKLSQKAQSNMQDQGDYIENGLLQCGKCHTTKECVVQLFGQNKIVYCLCKCEKEKRDKELAEYLRDEELRHIEQLKISGIQDRNIYNFTFENAEENSYINKAKKYCKNWEEIYKNNNGLLLWGDVGTGKTFMAGCIANELIKNKVPVMMTSLVKIINNLQGFVIADKNEYLNSLNRFNLLILDDLGAERQSDFALEQVFNVIDSRYKSGKPVIITTNLSLQELKNPSDIKYKRIYDRILEMCVPLQFKGESKRKEKSQAKLNVLKELFKD